MCESEKKCMSGFHATNTDETWRCWVRSNYRAEPGLQFAESAKLEQAIKANLKGLVNE